MSTQKRFKQKSKKNNVNVNEEQKRLEFFDLISTYSDDLLKSELASFSSMGNQQRQNFIGQLIQQDPTFIKDYIKSYLSQRKYKNYNNTQDFYNIFMNQYSFKIVVKDEESKRRELFSEIVDMEQDEFIENLNEFVDDGNEGRKKFIKKLKSTMGIKLYKKYIIEFLNQTSKNSEAYYREFMSREDNKNKKIFQKYEQLKEVLEEALEEEPTSYELFDEVDLGDGLFEEEEGASFEIEQPTQQKPGWFVNGKIIQAQEVQPAEHKRFWKLYTKQGCPYCVNATKILRERKEEFAIMDVTPEKLDELRPKIGDYNTVPIVLLNDEFIGGLKELEAKLSEIPVRRKVEIFEGIEGFYKEPTKLTDLVRTPPPVRKRSTLGFDPICYNKQVSLPWIDGQVEAVWLGPAPGDEMNMGYVINDNSIDNKPIINSDGVTFYKAGRSFYELQCNYYSHKRRQKEFVLTSYDINDNPVTYMVLYELPNKKFVYQDENLFNKQVEYLHGNISYSQEELSAIRKEVVSDNIRNWGKYLVKTVLWNNMEIDVKDYSDRLEAAIYYNHSTVESYFSAIVGITVFLDSMNDSIFKQRVKSLMYQPETLVELSIDEKLPEVFDNPNISQEKKNEAERYIDTLIKRQVNDLIKQIVQLRRPGLYKNQKKYTPGIITLPGLDTSNGPDCVKELLARDVDRVNIVYYTDIDGKTYCFDANELKDRFRFYDDYINVETGKEFPIDFRNKVLHLDQYIDPLDTEDLPITETPPEKEVEILAPGLLEKILDDIKRMETKITEEAIQEEIEDDSEVIENICGYCKEHIEQNTGIKTMINRNNSYELVNFCNEKCFEDIEEWNQGNEPNKTNVPGKSVEDIENQIVTVKKRKIYEDEFTEEVTTSYKQRKDVLPGEEIVE